MTLSTLTLNLSTVVSALATIQFYQLLRLLMGDTPYIGVAINWLPQLLAAAFGVFAWLPLLLFLALLFFKQEYVRPTKWITWSAVQWTFSIHVLMNVIFWRVDPNSMTFIGGLVYCMFALMNVILNRCASEQPVEESPSNKLT